MKRIVLTILLVLLGEAFIISAMLLLPHGLLQEVMILDIVVLSIIWCLFCYDLIRPIISDGDHAPEVGSLGIRWQGQLIYALLAIGFGVAAGIYAWPFVYQILGQGGLIGILLLTWLFSHMAGKTVSAVAAHEAQAIDGREQMKIAVREVQDALFECADAPEDVRATIQEIEGQLRFITPCTKAEAVAYEKKFVQLAGELVIALPHTKMEEEAVKALAARMQRTLMQRKQILN